MKLKFFALTTLVLFTFAFPSFAQTTTTPVAATVPSNEKLVSKLMGRDMPYRVILPRDYATKKDARFPVVYLLHGLTGHHDDWTNKAKLADHAAAYNYIIVTPEGNNGWYTDSLNVAADKYESYIIQELVPEIDSRFRTLADRDHRAIAGLSMGGYGSLKFGLKYPEKFVIVGSFSGALMATSINDKTPNNGWKIVTDTIMSVYGADDSETRKANDIFRLVREMTPEKAKTMPFFYVDCGTEDGLVQFNREFVVLLFEKKLPHEYRQLPGAHNWPYWDSQVQEFLRVSQRFIK